MKIDRFQAGGATMAATAVQHGAYALILDAGGRVLLVRTGGRHYLPGGRLEPGERPEQALAREIEEECGWRARVGARIAAAEQPIFGGAVTLCASYWTAELDGASVATEPHALLWADPEEAALLLHRAGDVAALSLVEAAETAAMPAERERATA